VNGNFTGDANPQLLTVAGTLAADSEWNWTANNGAVLFMVCSSGSHTCATMSRFFETRLVQKKMQKIDFWSHLV